MLVDDRPQVGVNQNGVWCFDIYFTLGAFELPCDNNKKKKKKEKQETDARQDRFSNMVIVLSNSLSRVRETLLIPQQILFHSSQFYLHAF